MRESPNKNAPDEDVKFIVEEIYMLFAAADAGEKIELVSAVGSIFHARVINAARHLDVP